jgi:hypothetical protein
LSVFITNGTTHIFSIDLKTKNKLHINNKSSITLRLQIQLLIHRVNKFVLWTNISNMNNNHFFILF